MHTSAHRLRDDAGLTLIEVMLALIVLLVAVLGVAAAFPAGLVASRLGEDVTKATHLAQAELEAVRGVGYATLRGRAAAYATESPWWPQARFNPDLTVAGGSGLYTLDTQVQCWTWNGAAYAVSAAPYASPCPLEALLRVQVRVDWTFKGVARSLELQTFVGDRE